MKKSCKLDLSLSLVCLHIMNFRFINWGWAN